jgi:hypothetical protein
MVTEPGNFYAILVGSLQNTRFGRTDDSLAVNAQSDGFQLNRSFYDRLSRLPVEPVCPLSLLARVPVEPVNTTGKRAQPVNGQTGQPLFTSAWLHQGTI